MMSIESPEFKEYIATAIAEGRENRLEEKNKELEQPIAQNDKEIAKLKQKLAQKE